MLLRPSILAAKMLGSQHDSAEGPDSPAKPLPERSAGAPRPRTLVCAGCSVAIGLLAVGGIEGLMLVTALLFVAAAIPLAHVMFGLPPAMQHEPPPVAAPHRVG